MRCAMCEGATYEEVLANQVAMVERYGWMFMAVSGPVPWVYTIGLRWYLAHPELMIVGVDPQDAAGILRRLVETIQAGTHFGPGDRLPLGGNEVRFGAVHHRNLAGEWFAQWAPTARAAGHGTTSLRALQVRIGEIDDCTTCGPRQVFLNRPCARPPDNHRPKPRGRKPH